MRDSIRRKMCTTRPNTLATVDDWLMSPPGPRPRPTQLKILHGDLRPLRKSEPKPRATRPTCPAWMSVEAKREWKIALRELDHMKLVAASDRAALVTLVQAIVMHRRASELVDKGGILIKSRDGGLVKNPAAQVVRDTATTILRVSEQYRLTPSARARMSMPQPEEDEIARRFLS